METSNVTQITPTPSGLTVDDLDDLNRKLGQARGIVALAAPFETYEQDTRKGDLALALAAAHSLIEDAEAIINNRVGSTRSR